MRSALILLLVAACDGSGLPTIGDGGFPDGAAGDLAHAACVPANPQVTLSRDAQPIFSRRCSGLECHGSQFGSGRTVPNNVNVPAPQCSDGRKLIAPGDPGGSYVMQKILGVELCGGARMPRLGGYLASDEAQVIADWICLGAKSD